MDELERRALMGDAEAQKECTKKGIVLPCPFCGGEAHIIHNAWVVCENCVSETKYFDSKEEAIAAWNTRAAPPIGRCGECKKNIRSWEYLIWCNLLGRNMMPDDYCSYFEPKQS